MAMTLAEIAGQIIPDGPMRIYPEPPTTQPPPSMSDDGLPPCEACNDLRVIRDDSPVGATGFGQLIPCPDCGVLAKQARQAAAYQRQRERIARYAIASDGRQTFDNFDPRTAEGDSTAPVRLALLAAQQFAHDPSGWLVLIGTNGTGKSHLARAIAHHLEANDHRPAVMVITAPDLLDLLRSGYGHDDYHDLLNLCRQVSVLILDDLGVEKGSEWAREKLLQVLDWRYQSRQPTVVVTNCRLDELEPRLRDRLACEDIGRLLMVLAPSYRQRGRSPGTVVQ